jgi:enoyl-CoA hydratase/carnithine racemase
MDEAVRLSVDGPVARVTLNRPEVLNAGDRRWVQDLSAIVRELGTRKALRVAVITGAGRAFCTGVDLGALAAGDFGLPDFIAWEDAMVALERLPLVTVAAINGHCLGGGLQLTLVCDYRIACKEALLGLPAVKECLIPSMSLYRLPRLIGTARARELILLGEPIGAQEAERYGLVHRVVATADFEAALEDTVARFLALPASSVTASKQLLTQTYDLGFEAFRAAMEARFRECLASPEHAAAMASLRAGAQAARHRTTS